MKLHYPLDQDTANDMGYLGQSDQPELNLWRAVLVQAIKDASGASKGKYKALKREQQEARNWFCDAAEDFQRVCDFAGLDPKEIQNSVLDLLTRPDLDLSSLLYAQNREKNS